MMANVLRGKTAAELQTELEALLREQFNLRMQKGSGQLAKTARFKAVRRDIARIKTVMTERTKAGT
jgi:large subunit ribosomal protein L29